MLLRPKSIKSLYLKPKLNQLGINNKLRLERQSVLFKLLYHKVCQKTGLKVRDVNQISDFNDEEGRRSRGRRENPDTITIAIIKMK